MNDEFVEFDVCMTHHSAIITHHFPEAVAGAPGWDSTSTNAFVSRRLHQRTRGNFPATAENWGSTSPVITASPGGQGTDLHSHNSAAGQCSAVQAARESLVTSQLCGNTVVG